MTAAEVGHLELAYDYAYEAAQIDLRDIDHNSRDGLHIASLAGVWTALVAGFGGLRQHDGLLSFAPQLPDGLTRLSFTVRWRGLLLGVDIEPDRATYTLRDGPDSSLSFRHNKKDLTVTTGEPVTERITKRPPMLPRPPQPPGREPVHRGRPQRFPLAAGRVAPPPAPNLLLRAKDPGGGEATEEETSARLEHLLFPASR